jgi:hypothetical protein
MSGSAYDNWDRSAGAARALHHADNSSARDAEGNIWNFAFGSNMSSSKVGLFIALFQHYLAQFCLYYINSFCTFFATSQVLSRGIKPIQTQPARLRGWCLLFNHVGGYGNIESFERIQQQGMDVSHLPHPLPQACHGVLLLVRNSKKLRVAFFGPFVSASLFFAIY